MLRRFGIEYLWIDCMCIIQGDSADWVREASCMASIYKNATFTISATHCNGSSDSLFSDPSQIIPARYVGDLPGGIPVHLEQHLPHPFRYSGVEYFENPMDPSLILLTRGWVYQEVLLSPRTLYFLANEIMWRCREHTVCQCARYDLDEDGYEPPEPPKAIADSAGPLYYSKQGCRPLNRRDWTAIVQTYSSKDLTYPQDKLPALAGIAEEYQNAYKYTYLCGLWWENAPWRFGWSRASGSAIAPRPDTNLPTWSWASIASEVDVEKSSAVEVEFESYQITYNNEGSPYMGDVKEAVINVTGEVFPATLVPPGRFDQYDDISIGNVSGEWGVSVMSWIMVLLEDCELTETSTTAYTDVLCLMLCSCGEGHPTGTISCLVLRAVDGHAERYERLGRVWINGYDLDNGDDDWKMDWGVSKKTLALV